VIHAAEAPIHRALREVDELARADPAFVDWVLLKQS
jgi:hypothetical protein